MGDQAWASFRSGLLRRVEFDLLFGVAHYPRPRPAAPASAPAPADLPRREAELAQLKQQADACTACPLHRGRTHGVFGTGSVGARLMVIGEAPGYYEDQRGEPFVGPAGELLDRQLQNVLHLERCDVYIANVLKCRPPQNRTPAPDERLACKPYLSRQIELVGPELILAVGRTAACWLLDVDMPVGQMRGKLYDYQGVPMIVTYHPAYLLRQTPKSEAHYLTWADLRRARDELGLKQPGDKD